MMKEDIMLTVKESIGTCMVLTDELNKICKRAERPPTLWDGEQLGMLTTAQDEAFGYHIMTKELSL